MLSILSPVEPLRFVAVGDVLVDVTIRGGPGHDARVSLRAGGSAANAAVWAASLGAASAVVGRVGDDLAGRALRSALAERGVECFLSVDPDAPSGTYVVVGGTRYVDRGATVALAPAELPEAIEADVVAISPYLELETARSAVARARASWIVALGKPLRGANAVVLAEAEAEQGIHELAAQHRLACVTLGGLGAIAILDGEEASASAPAVEAADATGAGDAFAAALLVSVARGEALGTALQRACRYGAEAAASSTGWPVVK
jgi:ribokinase